MPDIELREGGVAVLRGAILMFAGSVTDNYGRMPRWSTCTQSALLRGRFWV